MEKYRDVQNVQNQLVEAGYKVDVEEVDISEVDFGILSDVRVDIKVSW